MYTLLAIFAKITVGDKNESEQVNLPMTTDADLFTNALDLTYFIAGIVAVVVIVVSGIMYITSSGDAPKVAKAKNMLLYAVVGLILVILAFTITKIVIGRF